MSQSTRYPHKGLLLKSQKELCFECHQSLKRQIESRKLSHEPVERGECTVCHAPHAANYRNLLSGSLVESCAVCHDELQDQFANKHAPYAKGQCNSCHDPHAADDYRLLNKSTPGLCLDCHKQQERLKKKHMGRSPQTMDCLTCHNPHGGEQRALLRKVQHEPFANGDCRVCHSGNQTGIEVCTQCHDDVLTSFNHTSNHFLGAGQENLCTRCHTPMRRMALACCRVRQEVSVVTVTQTLSNGGRQCCIVTRTGMSAVIVMLCTALITRPCLRLNRTRSAQVAMKTTRHLLILSVNRPLTPEI